MTADEPGADDAPVAYIRLYADEHGDSRFEDVRLVGEIRGVGESELRAAFSEPFRVDTATFRYVVEEASDEHPHNAPRRQLIVQLTGECEIETSDGDRRRLVPGSVLLVEDTDGLGHITRRLGEENRLTLLIPLR